MFHKRLSTVISVDLKASSLESLPAVSSKISQQIGKWGLWLAQKVYMGQAGRSAQHLSAECAVCSLIYLMRALGPAVTKTAFDPQFSSFATIQDERAC